MRKMILVVILAFVILAVSGCFSDPGLFATQEGNGKVTITLSKDLTGGGAKALTPSISRLNDWPPNKGFGGYTWQRSAAFIAPFTTGYRIRITHASLPTTYRDVTFAAGQTSITTDIELPVGSGYTVSVLAIGPKFAPTNLSRYIMALGSGTTSGVTVREGTPTTVTVPLKPFQYSAEPMPISVPTNISAAFKVAVRGVTVGDEQGAPVGCWNMKQTPMTEDWLTPWHIAIVSSTTIGGNPDTLLLVSSPTTFYDELSMDYQFCLELQGWIHNDITPMIMAPCIALGESVPCFAIGDGKAYVNINVGWEDWSE